MADVKITWNGAAATAAERAGARRGLRLASEHVLTESRKVVPIEEGTLERSGEAQVDEANMRAAVTYRGPYAVIQHERLDYRHDAGRQAKYLEQPLFASEDVVRSLIAQQIRRELS